MQLQEMKRARAEALDAAAEIRAMAAKGEKLQVSHQVALEEYEKRVAELTPRIKEKEEQNTIRNLLTDGMLIPPATNSEGRLRKSQTVINSRPTTILEAMRHASPEEVEQIKAFARYIGGDISAVADLTPGGDAGVLIPETVVSVVERNYTAFAPVVSVARLWPTQTGEPTAFPVISDEEEAEILAPAALTGADDTVTGDKPPTAVTGPLLGAYKFSSKPIYVPRETITDSTVNVLDEMFNALLARIIRKQNEKFTKGTGVAEPEGFLKNATKYAAGAVALDLDVCLDLAYSVPALYRPYGVYMMSDTSVKYLRKLKTGLASDKRALWADADQTKGTPATLHGYPVVINPDMDDVAADGTFAAKEPVAFGSFKRFVVRRAEMGSPYVIRYEVPAKDGTAVIAFQRSDSKLIVPEAISKLVVA